MTDTPFDVRGLAPPTDSYPMSVRVAWAPVAMASAFALVSDRALDD